MLHIDTLEGIVYDLLLQGGLSLDACHFFFQLLG